VMEAKDGQSGDSVQLFVYDIDPVAVKFVQSVEEDLTANGAQINGKVIACSSIGDVVKNVSVFFLCLPNESVTDRVLFGEDGIINLWNNKVQAQRKTTDIRPTSGLFGDIHRLFIIDCGTCSLQFTNGTAYRISQIQRSLRETCDTLTLDFIDCPMTGMVDRARTGDLTFMCGGEKRLVDEVTWLLMRMGRKVVHMGCDVGCGQAAKMINNVIFDANVAALAEMLPLSVKLGLRPEAITEVINAGSGQSFASTTFLPTVLQSKFDGGFPLNLAYKDLKNIKQTIQDMNQPLAKYPIIEATDHLFQATIEEGHGHEDKGALLKYTEKQMGVSFRAPVE